MYRLSATWTSARAVELAAVMVCDYSAEIQVADSTHGRRRAKIELYLCLDAIGAAYLTNAHAAQPGT